MQIPRVPEQPPRNETMETIHKLLVEENLVSQNKQDDKSIIEAVKRVLRENDKLQKQNSRLTEQADYVDQLELDHNILQLKLGQFIQNDIIGPPCDYSAIQLFDPGNTLDKNHLNFNLINRGNNSNKCKKKRRGRQLKSKRKRKGKKDSKSVDNMPRSRLLQQLKDEVRKQFPTDEWEVQVDPKTGVGSSYTSDSKHSKNNSKNSKNNKNNKNRNKNKINDSDNNCESDSDWCTDSCNDTKNSNSNKCGSNRERMSKSKKSRNNRKNKKNERNNQDNKKEKNKSKRKSKNSNKSKRKSKSKNKNENKEKESKTAEELQIIYRDSILAYLTINNTEGSLNPHVLLTDLDDYWETQKDFVHEYQNKVLTKYKIGVESNVESLRGQYGIKAKICIPKYTTIGQYIGVELTRRQYNHIYRGTEHHVNCDKYAYTAQFIHLLDESMDYNKRHDNVDLSIRDDWDSHSSTNSSSTKNGQRLKSGQFCSRKDYIDTLIDIDISNYGSRTSSTSSSTSSTSSTRSMSHSRQKKRNNSNTSTNAKRKETSGKQNTKRNTIKSSNDTRSASNGGNNSGSNNGRSKTNRKRKSKHGSKKRGYSFVDCDMDTIDGMESPPRKRQRKNSSKRKYDSIGWSDGNDGNDGYDGNIDSNGKSDVDNDSMYCSSVEDDDGLNGLNGYHDDDNKDESQSEDDNYKNRCKNNSNKNNSNNNNNNIETETESENSDSDRCSKSDSDNNNSGGSGEEVIVESRLCELIDNYGNLKINEIVIDGLAMKKLKSKKDNLMILINDVRYDIEKENLSFQEQEKQNIEFVECEVSGWPSIFVITKQNINKGDVILGDYGDQYCQTVKEQTKWEKLIRKEAQSKIKKARQVGMNLIQDAEYFVQQSRM